jgi:hypothetical protein
MAKALKNFLRGFGSAFNPFVRPLPPMNRDEMMRDAEKRVGRIMYDVMESQIASDLEAAPHDERLRALQAKVTQARLASGHAPRQATA